MPQEPAPADPGRDEPRPGDPMQDAPYDWEPVITRPDPMTEEEREAWLDALAGEDEPFDAEEYPDPEGLRAAIVRAVIDVAPEKARKRREAAARDARVQQWAEDSGNAALMGRELPPAEVLAADQRITAWARQLRRPAWTATWTSCAPAPTSICCSARTPGPARTPQAGRTPRAGRIPAAGRTAAGRGPRRPDQPAGSSPAGPAASVLPAGFAGRITLTIPLATLLGLADRPGEIGGIGPIDPKPGANTPDCYQSVT